MCLSTHLHPHLTYLGKGDPRFPSRAPLRPPPLPIHPGWGPVLEYSSCTPHRLCFRGGQDKRYNTYLQFTLILGLSIMPLIFHCFVHGVGRCYLLLKRLNCSFQVPFLLSKFRFGTFTFPQSFFSVGQLKV